jgi:hypothetical protein
VDIVTSGRKINLYPEKYGMVLRDIRISFDPSDGKYQYSGTFGLVAWPKHRMASTRKSTTFPTYRKCWFRNPDNHFRNFVAVSADGFEARRIAERNVRVQIRLHPVSLRRAPGVSIRFLLSPILILSLLIYSQLHGYFVYVEI